MVSFQGLTDNQILQELEELSAEGSIDPKEVLHGVKMAIFNLRSPGP